MFVESCSMRRGRKKIDRKQEKPTGKKRGIKYRCRSIADLANLGPAKECRW